MALYTGGAGEAKGGARTQTIACEFAEHLALAAQPQVLLGDAEAVLGLAQDLEPRPRRFAERALVEQQAGRAAGAAPDPAAQLVQLREAEALGVLDHHDRRLGDVDADLDDGGGDQRPWSRRAGSAPSPRPSPAPSSGRGRGRPRRRTSCAGLRRAPRPRRGRASRSPRPAGRSSRRARPSAIARPTPATTSSSRSIGMRAGVDRLAAGRLLGQRRDVHVAEIGEHQRARDRRRGHHQEIDRLALAGEREALVDAEAVLLVDHGEAEVAEGDALLE